jgi:DNA invertase Pin-like site-specific DNA recombinase
MEACRLYKATLVIAKLDRLARNVAFVSALMESGVDFVAADFPQANRLTIHILAAVAEHEAAMVSQRTKAALAAAKVRGTKLGGFRGYRPTDEDRARAVAARRGHADERAGRVAPVIAEIRAAGATSLRAIAAELDARGIPTPRGGRWSATAVMRVTGAGAPHLSVPQH